MPQLSMRTALWITLIGSVVFWVGIPWPIGGEFFEADNDAARIAVVDENRAQYAASFTLLGLGGLIAAVGLWLLGRVTALGEVGSGTLRPAAAQLAAWLGLIGVLNGASRVVLALFASPETIVTSDLDFVLGTAGAVATSAALMILGLLAWAGQPPRWTAVVLVLGGILGAAMFLPFWWYAALLIFTIATLIATRRGAAMESPFAGAATPG